MFLEENSKKISLAKILTLEYGGREKDKAWFSFAFKISTLAKFFCSYKTKAYIRGFQSGIGGIINHPFYLAIFLSILDYRKGSAVENHSDGGIDLGKMKPLLGININLIPKKAKRGGEFICPEAFVNKSRIKIFNGDRQKHEVTTVLEGRRVVLAFKFSLAKLIKK